MLRVTTLQMGALKAKTQSLRNITGYAGCSIMSRHDSRAALLGHDYSVHYALGNPCLLLRSWMPEMGSSAAQRLMIRS